MSDSNDDHLLDAFVYSGLKPGSYNFTGNGTGTIDVKVSVGEPNLVAADGLELDVIEPIDQERYEKSKSEAIEEFDKILFDKKK
jgi:hypothetical protein